MENSAEETLLKIVLAGPTKSGKSNILTRYCQDVFNYDSLPTIGVEFNFKNIIFQEKRTKLQIWDTAGQQRFQALTFSYYRGAQVVVLVFDKSSVESFTSLDTFYNQSREKVDENTSTILVGNKTDLQPVISTEQGQSAARRFNAIYLEVSALTGENINNLFEVAAIEGMKVLQKNH